jgi:hypothetical protein
LSAGKSCPEYWCYKDGGLGTKPGEDVPLSIEGGDES